MFIFHSCKAKGERHFDVLNAPVQVQYNIHMVYSQTRSHGIRVPNFAVTETAAEVNTKRSPDQSQDPDFSQELVSWRPHFAETQKQGVLTSDTNCIAKEQVSKTHRLYTKDTFAPLETGLKTDTCMYQYNQTMLLRVTTLLYWFDCTRIYTH